MRPRFAPKAGRFIAVLALIAGFIATAVLGTTSVNASSVEVVDHSKVVSANPLIIMNEDEIRNLLGLSSSALIPEPTVTIQDGVTYEKGDRLPAAKSPSYTGEDSGYRAWVRTSVVNYMTANLQPENGTARSYSFPNSTDGTVTVKASYPIVGTYMGDKVGANVTYEIKCYPNAIGTSGMCGVQYLLIQLYDCLYSGIDIRNCEYINVNIEFFDYTTKEVISLDGNKTFLTVGSLNGYPEGSPKGTTSRGEAIASKTAVKWQYANESNIATAEDATFGTVAYGTSNEGFTDSDVSHASVYMNAASFFASGKDVDFTVLSYGLKEGDGETPLRGIWWSVSSASVATPEPEEPVKTVDKAEAEAGETLTYTIEQKVAVAGVGIYGKYKSMRITDNLPDGTTYKENSAKIYMVDSSGNASELALASGSFTYDSTANVLTYTFSDAYLGTMPMEGETYRVIFEAKIDDDAEAGSKLTNTAKVFVNDSGNEATAETTVIEPPEPVKVSDPESGSAVTAGSEITYTVSYTNEHTLNEKVSLFDAAPEGTAYVEGSLKAAEASAQPDASDIGDELSCTWNSVAPGETVGMSFTVNVSDTAADGTIIENTGDMTRNDDPRVKTNTTTLTVGTPKLEVEKTISSVDLETKSVIYNIVVKNTGTAPAEDVKVYDTFSDNLTFNRASVKFENGYFSVGDIAQGDQETITAVYSIADVAKGFRNAAYVPEEPTPNDPNDPDDPDVPGDPSDPPYTLDKERIASETDMTEETGSVKIGDTIWYLVSVENTEEVNLTDLTVTDKPSEGLKILSAEIKEGDGEAVVNTDGTVTWTIKTLKVKETASLLVSALVTEDAGDTVTNTAYDPNHSVVVTTPVVPDEPTPGTSVTPTPGTSVTPTPGTSASPTPDTPSSTGDETTPTSGKTPAGGSSVKTGDKENPILWGLMMAAALTGVAVFAVKRRGKF